MSASESSLRAVRLIHRGLQTALTGQHVAGASASAATAAAQTHSAASQAAHPSSSSGTLRPQNIWCVGRNYAEHARELGNAVPTVPMIFLKAGATAVPPGRLALPSFAKDVHHEVELAIEVGGPDLQPVRGAVALDLTARDVQTKLKQQQWPWTLAKSFTGSTPLGPGFSLQGVDVGSLQLVLDVNGKRRQHGRTADMVFSLPVLLQYIKDHFPVQPGDVILTGTPPGCCAMKAGDVVSAQVLGPDGRALSGGEWKVE